MGIEEKTEESQLVFSEDLIELNITASDDKEALQHLGHHLLTLNFVKDTYPEAIVEREKSFPTGLATKSIGIAIPHTDSKHVNVGSLAIATLKDPVIFKTMDTREDFEVSIIFMLAITHPSAQLKMLQKVIEMIQDDHALIDIKESKDKQTVMKIVKSFIGDLVVQK